MTSMHLVDPELVAALDLAPATDLSAESLTELRDNMAIRLAQQAATMELPSGVMRSECTVPGPPDAPDVRVLVYQGQHANGLRPAILHIHGGGYVVGTPEMTEARNAAWVDALDCVIVSVDYRLAPETVFPGPIEDCYAALRWLYSNAADLGIDQSRIAVVGESAGGGLAASLALLARDRGEVALAYQLMVYPMLDDRMAVEPHPFTGEFVWTRASNRFGWTSLLGVEPGDENVSPYAVPARAGNLGGLPPSFISVGALDLFLEENLEYARRLTRAGVPVELHVYPGAYHGFGLAPEARVSKMHERDQLDALRHAFSVKSSR